MKSQPIRKNQCYTVFVLVETAVIRLTATTNKQYLISPGHQSNTYPASAAYDWYITSENGGYTFTKIVEFRTEQAVDYVNIQRIGDKGEVLSGKLYRGHTGEGRIGETQCGGSNGLAVLFRSNSGPHNTGKFTIEYWKGNLYSSNVILQPEVLLESFSYFHLRPIDTQTK